MALSELQRVAEHVQLGESGLGGLGAPVLLDIIDCCTPGLDVLRLPVALVQQVIVQLLKPAREDGVRCPGRCFDAASSRSSCEESGAASLLDPLANLRPVEVM